MRTYRIAQGTLVSALWGPEWEGNPKKRGFMYTYIHMYKICITDSLCYTAEIL